MAAVKTPGRTWATPAEKVAFSALVALLLFGAQIWKADGPAGLLGLGPQVYAAGPEDGSAGDAWPGQGQAPALHAAAETKAGEGLDVYGRNEFALVYLWADSASQSLYLDYPGLSQGLSLYRILDLGVNGTLAGDVYVEGRLKNRVGEWATVPGAGHVTSPDLPWTVWTSSAVRAGWTGFDGGWAGAGFGGADAPGAGGYGALVPEDEIWLTVSRGGGTPWGLRIGDFTVEAGWWNVLPYHQDLVGAVGEVQLGPAALGGFWGETRGGLVRESLRTVDLVVTYCLAYPPVASGSETVRLGGRDLVRGRDYDIDYETGELRLSVFPLPGDVLDVNYMTLIPGVGQRGQAYGVLSRVSSGDTQAGLFALSSVDVSNSLAGVLRVVRNFGAGTFDVEVGRVDEAVPAAARLSLRGPGLEAAAAFRADSLAGLGDADLHYGLDLKVRQGVIGPVALSFSWARDEGPAAGAPLTLRVAETRRVTADYSPAPGAGLSLGYQESLLGRRAGNFWDLSGLSVVRTVTARGQADETALSLPGLSLSGTLVYRLPYESRPAVIGSIKAGYRPAGLGVAVDAQYDRSTSYSQEDGVRLDEKGSVKVEVPLNVPAGQELLTGVRYSFDSGKDRLGLLLRYKSESGLWAEVDMSETTYLSIGYSAGATSRRSLSLRAEAGAEIQDLRIAAWEADAEIAAGSLFAGGFEGGARGGETSAAAGNSKGDQVSEFLARHRIQPSAGAVVHMRRSYGVSDDSANLRGFLGLELRFDVRREALIKVSGGYLLKEDYENPADGYRAAGIATSLSVAF